jgi:ABC-2 type transport system permease protein
MTLVIGGVAVGLLRNPLYGWRAAPFILAGALLFAVTNLLLSAGTKHAIERWFARARLKEVLMLLFVFGSLLPKLLAYSHVHMSALLRFAPSQVVWPWAAAGRLMVRDSTGLSILTALLWLGVTALFTRQQFERSLVFDADSVRRPERADRSDGLIDRLYRTPSRFLPDPIAVVMEKELRTFARIPRCRLVYAMSCFFGAVFFLPSLRGNRPHSSFFQENALPFVALYGLLMLGGVTFWNSFGFDRSATQGYFCWPVRFRDILIAKNLAVVALLIPQILLVSAMGSLMHLTANPIKILETFGAMTVASLYWLALGNIFSVRMPRPLNPEKMNQMSNKLQALSIWTAPVVLLPLAVAYWARWFFESQWVFAGIMAVAAAAGGVFYWVALDSAVTTAIARRETMMTELSQSDGPLSIA